MPEFTFADFAAAPVNNPNAVISNVDVVRNRAALRMAGAAANQSAAASLKAQLMNNENNQSAAAALKAQLLNNDSDQNTTSATNDTPADDTMMGEERGTKRKADNDLEAGDEEDEQVDDDMPDTAEGTDLVAQGKAILEKVAADKKAKDDAAMEREPDDAVR